jgi:hypothetical protein
MKYLLRSSDELLHGVKVTPRRYDFGSSAQNEELKSVLKVKNTLPYSIELRGILSSCECTTIKNVAGMLVDSQEEIEIPVTLSTRQSEGPITATATVYFGTRDRLVPAWQSCTLETNVVADYVVRPNLIDLGTVDGATGPVTRTVHLRPVGKPDIIITNIESDHPGVTARQIPSPRGNDDLFVEITCVWPEVIPSTAVSATVRLHTTSAKMPVTEIIVQAFAQSRLTVTPCAVVIGTDEHGAVMKVIDVISTVPVRLSRAVSTESAVTLQWVPGKSRRHSIEVYLPKETANRPVNATIDLLIETPNADGKPAIRTVSVPLHRIPINLGEEQWLGNH